MSSSRRDEGRIFYIESTVLRRANLERLEGLEELSRALLNSAKGRACFGWNRVLSNS